MPASPPIVHRLARPRRHQPERRALVGEALEGGADPPDEQRQAVERLAALGARLGQQRRLGGKREVADEAPVGKDDPHPKPLFQRKRGVAPPFPAGEGGLGSPFPDRGLVCDLALAADTPLLATARAAGCQTLDGLTLLVQRVGAAFERLADKRAPLGLMTARAREAASPPGSC
jgi:hypothetical protein